MQVHLHRSSSMCSIARTALITPTTAAENSPLAPVKRVLMSVSVSFFVAITKTTPADARADTLPAEFPPLHSSHAAGRHDARRHHRDFLSSKGRLALAAVVAFVERQRPPRGPRFHRMSSVERRHRKSQARSSARAASSALSPPRMNDERRSAATTRGTPVSHGSRSVISGISHPLTLAPCSRITMSRSWRRTSRPRWST